jgi:hypothetical protein
MRAAEYRVPRAGAGAGPDPAADAECTVITFGKGMGGSVDDNIDRWVKQLDGASAPVRTTRTVHGMQVTRVEATGTYLGMQMPGAPASPPRPGSRLIGAIVEAPGGSWYFKLTGPDATVKAAAAEFDALVDSSLGRLSGRRSGSGAVSSPACPRRCRPAPGPRSPRPPRSTWART